MRRVLLKRWAMNDGDTCFFLSFLPRLAPSSQCHRTKLEHIAQSTLGSRKKRGMLAQLTTAHLPEAQAPRSTRSQQDGCECSRQSGQIRTSASLTPQSLQISQCTHPWPWPPASAACYMLVHPERFAWNLRYQPCCGLPHYSSRSWRDNHRICHVKIPVLSELWRRTHHPAH